MKYVIHLGVHRTASHLLQQNLSENTDLLRAQNVFYVNAEWPRAVRRQTRMIRRRHKPGATPNGISAFEELNEAITRTALRAGAETILISDENRLGPSLNQHLVWGQSNPIFYPQASTNLRHSLAGIPLQDTRLLLYTRNPESYLLSLYSDAIRNNHTTLSLEQFCRTVNFNSIDFTALEREISALHPELEIKSRQYERIKLGPETYLRTFLRDIGLDPKPITLHTAPLQPQLDAIQVEALLHIMAGSQSKRADTIDKLRDQVMRGAPNPLAPLVLPEWVTESMRVSDEGRASDAA